MVSSVNFSLNSSSSSSSTSSVRPLTRQEVIAKKAFEKAFDDFYIAFIKSSKERLAEYELKILDPETLEYQDEIIQVLKNVEAMTDILKNTAPFKGEEEVHSFRISFLGLTTECLNNIRDRFDVKSLSKVIDLAAQREKEEAKEYRW